MFDGIDSCIYCTVPTYKDGVFRVTFPDPGEVECARARDNVYSRSTMLGLKAYFDWISDGMIRASMNLCGGAGGNCGVCYRAYLTCLTTALMPNTDLKLHK